MRDEVKKAWDAAKTDEEKRNVLMKYANELSQEELETFCGRKLTKENMEMLAGGKGFEALYCCAWN